MEFTKNNISKKYIKSLFFDTDGKEMLKVCRDYFEKYNFTLKNILSEFENLDNVMNKEYWEKIVSIVNECFNSSISIDVYNLHKQEDFEKLLNDMLLAKFDFVFEPSISKKIKNSEMLKESIDSFKKENQEIIEIKSDEGVRRLIIPTKKKYYANASPHEPKSLFQYPNVLVKIKGKKISFSSHSKKSLSSVINKVQPIETEEEILTDFYDEKIDELEIHVKNFFSDLKDRGFFIKEIKFNSPIFYFTAGSKTTILDFEKLVDADFYLNTPLDFINIKQIKMVYNKNIGNKSKDFKVNIKLSLYEDKLRFSVSISKDKLLDDETKNEIINKLKNIGIKQEVSYELPLEYYLNKFLYKDGSLKKLYGKISDMEGGKEILNVLSKEKILILDENSVELNDNKLKEYFVNHLKNLTKESYLGKVEIFRIMKVGLDNKKRIYLEVRFSPYKTGSKNEDYQVIIYNDVRGYDKILKIILYNFDRAFILENIIKNQSTKILGYVYNRIRSYLLYEYNIQLEKEVNSAHRWLKEYSEKFAEMEKKEDPKKLGDIVEKKLNILIKYLYKNYLLIGGQNKPDGYLYKKNNEVYLIDSKQHKNIKIGEIDKVARYLFGFCKEEGLPKASTGVLVVCREKLGKSLNKSAVDNWKNSEEFKQNFKIGLASLEFFLELFELIKKPEVSANNELKNKVLESFYDVVEKSIDFSEKKELIKYEDKILSELRKKIDRYDYIPKEVGEI